MPLTKMKIYEAIQLIQAIYSSNRNALFNVYVEMTFISVTLFRIRKNKISRLRQKFESGMNFSDFLSVILIVLTEK